jgi:hypothetical protein
MRRRESYRCSAARAQQAGKVARIGFPGATSATAPNYAKRIPALRSALRDLGYEGINLVIEYRWARKTTHAFPSLEGDRSGHYSRRLHVQSGYKCNYLAVRRNCEGGRAESWNGSG